jgi:hypothetical protein
MATLILQIIHGLASLSCLYGFYLDRWSTVVNVMIYKKPGVLELDKLRVIHLFEADFNLIVGLLFGRRAKHHTVDHPQIHTGQYGIPRSECQDAAFAKILHNHMAHYSKTPLGQFESHAASCFDRIVMAFCFAVMSVWGAPTSALRMWEQTLYSIVHSVKTALGLSKDTYTYSTTSPIIGPGQGSMGGPAACSTITSPLLTAMDRLAHGLTFTSPDKRVHYAPLAKMFIDDNTNYSNDFRQWARRSSDTRSFTRYDPTRRPDLGTTPLDLRWPPQAQEMSLLLDILVLRHRRYCIPNTLHGPASYAPILWEFRLHHSN